MINQQTLQQLLSNDTIKSVTTECADLGLSDIRLFVTNKPEDSNKIHFLGKGEQEGVSLYLIRQTEKQLAQVLGHEVVVRSEDDLNELFKEEVLSNTANYTQDNKENITIFFEQQILPRAQGEFFLEEEIQEEDEEVAEELLEKFKEDPNFGELAKTLETDTQLLLKVEQHPKALLTALRKVAHQAKLQPVK